MHTPRFTPMPIYLVLSGIQFSDKVLVAFYLNESVGT
jgi:hypothetical protein